MWSLLSHANGVTMAQNNDPFSMRRPNRIFNIGVLVGTPFDSGNYAYDGSGNVESMGADLFEYDLLSRVEKATVRGWDQELEYDGFGNLELIRTRPPGGIWETLDPLVTQATNRLASHQYDGSGNLTNFDGVWEQAYDPVNMAADRRPTPADPSEWAAIYTAGDERLATWDLSSEEVEQHWTLRSPSGQILRDFRFGLPITGALIFSDGFESGDTSAWCSVVGLAGPPPVNQGASCPAPEWSIDKSYVYRGGALLADYKAGEARHYHLDHLGSVRQITGAVRQVLETRDYLPFGKELSASEGKLQFTGHERDSHAPGDEDDLDYMHARYYTPHLGRFLSVDPAEEHQALTRPQKWNRYSYVENNPMAFVDPDGRESAGILLDLDIQALQRGEITREEFRANIRARGIAAGVGAAGGFAALAAPEALPFLMRTFPGLTAAALNPQVQNAVTNTAAALADQPSPAALLGRASSLLKPGGQLIGQAGKSRGIRFVEGSTEAAQGLFAKLSQGGRVISQGKSQTTVALEGLGTVTFRTVSNTEGVIATIDVRIAGIGTKRIKFFERLSE